MQFIIETISHWHFPQYFMICILILRPFISIEKKGGELSKREKFKLRFYGSVILLSVLIGGGFF